MNTYHAFENLRQHRARLHGSVQLDSGIQLASWSNDYDRITQLSDHHTLSLYVHEGHNTWQKTASGWKNGGGTDHFCLMPANSETTWDIRSPFAFVHLYCTDAHLRELAEKIWDRNPASVSLDERIFAQDDSITQLYRHFLLSTHWGQAANSLMLSSASTLLLTHLLQHYSSVQWQTPSVKGGLAPVVLRNTLAWIEAHLADGITLKQLAEQAGLSEFHFARMFRQSMNSAPHQYVMQRRMTRADEMIRHSPLSLTDIALACGFSSASHFSHRFKRHFGIAPSALRNR
ncbi:AraC family transcriptional regulator [Enterobacterales bacterium CwR94]|nr:AraC family transcriptional regulator [Enterobacterales bacterium CwR94]